MEIIRTREFIRQTSKIKDKQIRKRVFKHIKSIIDNPERGSFLSHEKGVRKVYIPPFRLLYAYRDGKIYLLDFGHRDKIYRKKTKGK